VLEQADDLGRNALGIPIKDLLAGPDAREIERRTDIAGWVGRR